MKEEQLLNEKLTKEVEASQNKVKQTETEVQTLKMKSEETIL
jgi:hypothetical protein